MKIKNIALTISLVAFAIGFSDLHENLFFWLGRPVGAIFFIVYFIFMLLDKEYAILDEQTKKASLPAANNTVSKETKLQGTTTTA